MKKLKHRLKRPGIRTQVILGFMLFTAVIVALLWTFQIALLNTFYKAIKTNEVKNVAAHVAEMLSGDEAATAIFDITRETNISILIADSRGNGLTVSPTAHGDSLEKLSAADCLRIFLETKRAGGSTVVENESRRGGKFSENGRKDLSIISTRIATMKDGEEFLIMLSTSIVPVDSTVETLKIQLWFLTGAMLVLALFLALFIASRLSRPLEEMNNSAKSLAKGRYDIRFPEAGARETAELAATLNYAAEELSKVDGLRRELLANVSHDLRTPLTMIAGYGEVMRDIPGENTPENVQVVIDEANRLARLVNDMLDLSKLQAGAMTLATETYSLTADIRDTLGRYDKLAGYSFPFTADGEVLVTADRLKISQVIYNLVNNAVQYSGADKTVSVVQTVHDGVVRIAVSDTGEGIPADKLPHIWERYYKVDKTHARPTVGTGLGLAIVRSVLELHGGRYGVVSTENAGSTFWFELPLALDKAGEKD